jgi:hypothetical protein
MGELRNVCTLLFGRSEVNRQFGRPRHRCEDNIKAVFKEIGLEDVDWIYLDRDTYHWRVLLITIMTSRLDKRWGMS